MSDVKNNPDAPGTMRYLVTRDDSDKIRGVYRTIRTSAWFNKGKGDGWEPMDDFLTLWEDSDYELVDESVVNDWLQSRS